MLKIFLKMAFQDFWGDFKKTGQGVVLHQHQLTTAPPAVIKTFRPLTETAS